MRHEREAVDPRMSGERLIGPGDVFADEAEAVHAAIHLQIDVERRGCGAEHLDLLAPMDHGREPVAYGERDVARLEHAFQHQDRLRHAGTAQARRLLEVEHREAVGAGGGARSALEAVAVGIRLDHRPNFRVACMAARDAQVVCDGARRDGGADRAGHFSYCAINARFPRTGQPRTMKGT